MSDVVRGDEDRLALILGHELSHILLGHTQCKEGSDLASLVLASFTRDQEFAADAKGAELALAAGYSVQQGLRALQEMDEKYGYSSLEALSVDHPSFKDRLAHLDKQQAQLWRAMSAFENGVYFLATENYALAERCFQGVTEEFPGSADAWVNQGYAALMQYADGLRTDDLRSFGIGQIVAGGFYARPAWLAAKVRGIDAQKWGDALTALRHADSLNPKLALAKANLGLAYLVRPQGKDLNQAIGYLEQAVELAKEGADNELTRVSVAALANNLAVAYSAAGRTQEAAQLLQSGSGALGPNPAQLGAPGLLGESALRYNYAMYLAGAPDPTAKQESLKYFEAYLVDTSPSSAWWPLAFERYTQLCRPASCRARTQDELQKESRPLRSVLSVDLGPRRTIALGQSVSSLRADLGAGTEVSRVQGTNVARFRYAQYGVDVLQNDAEVLAIILSGANAPALPLRASGMGTASATLRVGMTPEQVDALLKNQPYNFDALADTWQAYRFYPDLGIAVRLGNQRKVEELVVVRPAHAP